MRVTLPLPCVFYARTRRQRARAFRQWWSSWESACNKFRANGHVTLLAR